MEKNVIFLIFMLSITITALIYFIINYYVDCKKVNNIQINYDQDLNINQDSDNLSDKIVKNKVDKIPKKKVNNNLKSIKKTTNKIKPVNNIVNQNTYELIFYWANWCGVCQKVKPLWKQARNEIEKIYKNVLVKEVNCDTPSVDKCYINSNDGKQMLDGVPTIILRSKDRDLEYKRNDVLTGDRTKEDLIKFLEINLKK